MPTAPAHASTPAPQAGAAARLEHLLLGLTALLIPLSETGALVAGGLAVLATAVRHGRGRADRPGLLSGLGTAGALVAVGLAAWVLLGLVGALASGHLPRSGPMNKVFLLPILVLGVHVARNLDRRERAALGRWLAAGLALAALAGFAQVLFGSFPGESLLEDPSRVWQPQLNAPGRGHRAATGPLRNRLKMVEVLLMGLPLVGAWALRARPLRRPWVLLLPLALAAALALNWVRAALAAVPLFAAAVAILVWLPRSRRWVGAGLAAFLVAGIAVPGALALTLDAGPVRPEGHLDLRRWIWDHGLEVFADHPVVGSGIGTYSRVSPPYFPEGEPLMHTLTPHNQHLTHLAEGGILGFAGWLLVCVGFGLALHRLWRRPDRSLTPGERSLRDGLTVFTLSLGAMAVFHDVLFHPTTALLFWGAVGAALGLASPRPSAASAPSAATETSGASAAGEAPEEPRAQAKEDDVGDPGSEPDRRLAG